MVRSRIAVLAVSAFAFAAGCGGGDTPSVAERNAQRTDWSAAAVTAMNDLASRTTAAVGGCADYAAYPFAGIQQAQAKTLPLPGAQGSCTALDDESVEFSVFADADATKDFIDAKQSLLCGQAKAKSIPYPGFDYVDGGTWVIQPDSAGAARTLAEKLGGEAKTASCR